MDNKELLRQIYLECTPEERKRFLDGIKTEIKFKPKFTIETFDELMRKERFSEGVCCPHCGVTHIGPHGSYKGNKRYICYDCGKTFNLTTKSVFHCHKQDLETYLKYIELMIHQVSIREAARICKISRQTSFLWRHKFLDTLQSIADKVTIGGIVEADETYFKLSFKGSRVLPRKAHKRGNDVEGAGLSEEFVCVPCAVERNKAADKVGTISRATNLATPNRKTLQGLFENRILPESILCTDGKAEYVSMADQLELQTIQLRPTKKHKASVLKTRQVNFHINHVNAYHSNIKNFFSPFRGVATKYINNYLNWNNFLNQLKSDEPKEFLTKLFANQISTEKSKEVQQKPAIPFKTHYDKFFAVQGIYLKGPNHGKKVKPIFGKLIDLDDKRFENMKFNPNKGK